MSWECVSIKLQLLSPLHIGFLPNKAGTVIAQTRCYVPGKTMWGAITARLTSVLFPNPQPADFQQIGKDLAENIYFSYFYISDGKQIFTPEYSADEGLKWGSLTDKEFRRRFISSRVSTAIEGKTGSAKDETLHESEFINHQTKDKNGEIQPVYLAGIMCVKYSKENDKRLIKINDNDPAIYICYDDKLTKDKNSKIQPVCLTGIVFVDSNKKNAGQSIEINDNAPEIHICYGDKLKIDIFEGISIGGDRNYGLGLVKRIRINNDDEKLYSRFPQSIDIEKTDCLLGHFPYCSEYEFQGDIELISTREYNRKSDAFTNPGQFITKPEYFFVPGTRLESLKSGIKMDKWGQWSVAEQS